MHPRPLESRHVLRGHETQKSNCLHLLVCHLGNRLPLLLQTYERDRGCCRLCLELTEEPETVGAVNGHVNVSGCQADIADAGVEET